MRANGEGRTTTWIIAILAVVAVIVVVRWTTNSGPRPALARGGANPPAADRVNEALGLHASQVAPLAVEFAHDGTFSITVPIDAAKVPAAKSSPSRCDSLAKTARPSKRGIRTAISTSPGSSMV